MIKLFQVDAFTEVPFSGNPAAVCLLDTPKDEQWMMNVASEMNLSETAFLSAHEGGYNLRWFTPLKEVSLCGHATLASAHVLWEQGYVSAGKDIQFYTMSGLLTAKRRDESIQLDFPARFVELAENNLSINEALGAIPLQSNSYTIPKGRIFLLEFGNEDIIRGLTPDFRRLAATDARAVIVTAKSDSEIQDFVSRYFAPAVGIDEDPVTGSAHCYLAPYWAAKLGKQELIGLQVSKRSGYVRCKHISDRVFIMGKAVTIFKTELLA